MPWWPCIVPLAYTKCQTLQYMANWFWTCDLKLVALILIIGYNKISTEYKTVDGWKNCEFESPNIFQFWKRLITEQQSVHSKIKLYVCADWSCYTLSVWACSKSQNQWSDTSEKISTLKANTRGFLFAGGIWEDQDRILLYTFREINPWSWIAGSRLRNPTLLLQSYFPGKSIFKSESKDSRYTVWS